MTAGTCTVTGVLELSEKKCLLAECQRGGGGHSYKTLQREKERGGGCSTNAVAQEEEIKNMHV